MHFYVNDLSTLVSVIEFGRLDSSPRMMDVEFFVVIKYQNEYLMIGKFNC